MLHVYGVETRRSCWHLKSDTYIHEIVMVNTVLLFYYCYLSELKLRIPLYVTLLCLFRLLARFCALTFEPWPQWPEFSKGCTMYTALTDQLQTSSFPFHAGWYLKRSLERLPQSTSNQQTRPEIKT